MDEQGVAYGDRADDPDVDAPALPATVHAEGHLFGRIALQHAHPSCDVPAGDALLVIGGGLAVDGHRAAAANVWGL